MLLTALLKPAVVVNGKKYKIMSQIGEGAFGYVYHVRSAHANDKGDSYALKKMICQTDEQMIEAKREMDVMLKIDHCNVMPLLNFSYLRNKKGQDEVYMVMPLYHNSVQAIIDHGPGFPYCAFNDGLDVVKILRHSMEGLRALHEAGFRHGDFKPANILVTETFDAVITDFGSTSPLETKVTSRATALQVQDFAASHSTASYRAPELFDTPNECIIDGKADMWALGCTMFCLLFSRTPFETAVEGLSTLSVMASQYTVPDDNIWPEDYLDLIRRCLTVDVAQRIDAQEMQLSLKRLSGPPLDLQRQVKVKITSPVDSAAAVSPTSTAGSLSQAPAAGEVSPISPPSDAHAVLAHSTMVHAEKVNAVPPPPPEQPSSPGSFRFSADFANFEGAPIGEEKSSPAGTGKFSGDDTNLEGHIARDSSIGDFASSSLSFSAGRRDSWGGFVSVGSRQEASSLVAALVAEVASSSAVADDEGSAEDAAAKAEASSVAATDSPFVVDMQGSGSEGPNKDGSESMTTSMVDVAISEHTDDGDDDDAAEVQSTSQQPEDHASEDAEDDEEEFGDFSSTTVAPIEIATGPRLTHPSDVPPHVTTDGSTAGGGPVASEDRSKASSPTVDLHQHLLHEATMAEHVLKQGKVYMMRLGGFPKKMMRKEVWLVVTSTGLIVQKESGATSEHSKIHELLSFHQPLSLTPSDTLTVGLNGLLMNGFSPLALSSSTSLSAFSHPSTPSSSMSTASEDNDWVQIDLSPKGSASSSSYGIVVAPPAASTTTTTTTATSSHRVRSRFVACRIELAFPNKDELNEWMDVIWQQYEVTRGFT